MPRHPTCEALRSHFSRVGTVKSVAVSADGERKWNGWTGAVDGTVDDQATQNAKEVAEIGELVGKIESGLRELEG